MYVCQWHLDVPFGKQGEALATLRAWNAENLKSSEFRRAKSLRLLVGNIGPSPSHIVTEAVFENLADYEAALASMGQPQFAAHAQKLAPLVVPGSQHWEIYKLVE